MKQLEFTVTDMTLKTNETYQGIVRGTDNYIMLHFVFDPSWRNRRKVIHMEDVEGNAYNCIVGNDNKVLVPSSVTGTSRIYVKIYGKQGSVTVNTNTVVIEQE